MNHFNNKSELSKNIKPTVTEPQLRIDNLPAQMWSALGLNGHLGRSGMTKRNGLSACETVFLLLMWCCLIIGPTASIRCAHWSKPGNCPKQPSRRRIAKRLPPMTLARPRRA